LQAEGGCKQAAHGMPKPAGTWISSLIYPSAAGRAGDAMHGVWFASVGEDHCLDLKPALSENFVDQKSSVFMAETLVRWNMRSRRTSGRHIEAALAGIAQCFVVGLKRIEADALPGERGFKPSIGARPASFARLLMVNAWNVLDLAATSFTLDMWNVGVFEGGSAQSVFDPSFMDNIHWLRRDKGWLYRADPFGFRRADGETIVFHEAYDYRTGKGNRAACRGSRVDRPRVSRTRCLSVSVRARRAPLLHAGAIGEWRDRGVRGGRGLSGFARWPNAAVRRPVG
jgi:hypothetical protein